MQPLQVTSGARGGCTVVRLSGELDIANADDLRQRLHAARRAHGDHMILDLESLEFMDSHGLSVIINCYKAVSESGGSLALAAPRPIIRRTLEVTGLHRRLTITASVTEAIEARSGEVPVAEADTR